MSVQEVYTKTQNQDTPDSDKIRFPTQEYTRETFFKQTDNIRYNISFHLVNGVQASDCPVGIENIIELIGDIKNLLDQYNNISINHEKNTKWTAKLNIEYADFESINTRDLEKEIESIAESYNIALRKTISMSGRGYQDRGQRLLSVDYSFGSFYENQNNLISDPDIPITNINWTGGDLGRRENLNENPVEIKEVRSLTNFEIFYRKIKSTVVKYI